MNLRPVVARLSRIVARAGMDALLDRSARSGDDDGRAARDAAPRTTLGRPGHVAGTNPGSRTSGARSGAAASAYRGDWRAPLPATRYAPIDDGRPDPGEVVWAWVPFEEDHTRGKDRPVLVVARHPDLADVVLALPLTSKDHDRDAAQEARAGRHWMDVGSGGWDSRGRPSEVRLDRVLQLDVAGARREGSRIDEQTFDAVITAARTATRGA